MTINKRVKVIAGRNKGQFGWIQTIKNDCVFVSFDREESSSILALNTADEGTWIKKEFVEA